MPISMNQLLEKTEKITGEFDGETWEVHFYPHKISDDVWSKLNLFRNTEGFEPLNEVLEYLIADWDFVQSPGDPSPGNKVPIKIDWLRHFPTTLKTDIASKMMDTVNPDPKSSSENSSSGLSLMESSANAPIGMSSSRPANISELHPGRLLGPITQPDTQPGSNGQS